MHILATERDHDGETVTSPGPHKERHEVAGRGVGPMQILKDEQHLALGCETVEELQERREQAGLARPLASVARHRLLTQHQLGPQARKLSEVQFTQPGKGGSVADNRAERGHDRRVRKLTVGQLEALSDQRKLSLLGGAVRELGDKPTLADPCVARYQDGTCVLQRREVLLPAHEPFARDAPDHRCDYRR